LPEAQRVLNFWFGSLENEIDLPQDKSSMWFVNGANYDEVIREQFLQLHNQACNGQLNDWQDSPTSLLALIILLNQFSRHIYRNLEESFAQDERAIKLVKKGIDAGYDQSLYFVERQFFYMPLMHSENLDTQNLSVNIFAKLADVVPEELKQSYASTLSFAESHRFVISKFGRFPELNEILGRDNTILEQEFLESGEYRFL